MRGRFVLRGPFAQSCISCAPSEPTAPDDSALATLSCLIWSPPCSRERLSTTGILVQGRILLQRLVHQRSQKPTANCYAPPRARYAVSRCLYGFLSSDCVQRGSSTN